VNTSNGGVVQQSISYEITLQYRTESVSFHLIYWLNDDKAVIMAISEWIEEQKQNFFLEGVKTLEQRWEKCVAH